MVTSVVVEAGAENMLEVVVMEASCSDMLMDEGRSDGNEDDDLVRPWEIFV